MGRGARYLLGFGTAGLLALAGLVCLVVALFMSVGLTEPGGTEGDYYSSLTGRTTATVIDVDDYGDDDVYVDLDFETPDEHVVTDLFWPAQLGGPTEGRRLGIAYDPEDAEYGVAALDARGEIIRDMDDSGDDQTVNQVAFVPVALADELDGSGLDGFGVFDGSSALVALTGAGFLLAALLCAVATVFWARRAPARLPQNVSAYATPHPPPYTAAYPPWPGQGGGSSPPPVQAPKGPVPPS